MIYLDESTIKIGGVILPGLFKSIEIKGDALIEEQTVEGRTEKPKQATGYEDAKINVELLLYDGPELTKLQKLEAIQNLFKKSGQAKPVVYEMVNEHTAVRGVTQVIFKNLTTKEQNKNDELSVMIELWEYVAMTITATATATETSSSTSSAASKAKSTSATNTTISTEYQGYLSSKDSR